MFIVNPLHARSIDNLLRRTQTLKTVSPPCARWRQAVRPAVRRSTVGPARAERSRIPSTVVSNADGAVLGTNGRSAKNQIDKEPALRYGPAMNLAAKDIVPSARARAHTILHEVLTGGGRSTRFCTRTSGSRGSKHATGRSHAI